MGFAAKRKGGHSPANLCEILRVPLRLNFAVDCHYVEFRPKLYRSRFCNDSPTNRINRK